MGPRGHGPIKHFVSPVGFQTTFWDFGHVRTSPPSQTNIVGFRKIAVRDLALFNPMVWKPVVSRILINMKGAPNDSSRSLIWSFWEQIVFLEICEKVSKVSKLNQFWVHPRWS